MGFAGTYFCPASCRPLLASQLPIHGGDHLSPAITHTIGVAAAEPGVGKSGAVMRERAGIKVIPGLTERHAEASGRAIASDERDAGEPEPGYRCASRKPKAATASRPTARPGPTRQGSLPAGSRCRFRHLQRRRRIDRNPRRGQGTGSLRRTDPAQWSGAASSESTAELSTATALPGYGTSPTSMCLTPFRSQTCSVRGNTCPNFATARFGKGSDLSAQKGKARLDELDQRPIRFHHRHAAQAREPLRRGGAKHRVIPGRSRRAHEPSRVPETSSVRVDGCCRGRLQVNDRRKDETGSDALERHRRQFRHCARFRGRRQPFQRLPGAERPPNSIRSHELSCTLVSLEG